MSKAQLKKHLNTLDKSQIIEMVMELYDARKEARDYLDYYVNPNESNGTGEVQEDRSQGV